jgi:CRP-like cAMP-binding protein
MKEAERLIEQLHPLERAVLPVLRDHLSFEDIAKFSNLQEVEATRALQWLENKEVLRINKSTKELITIASNGKKYVQEG